MNKSYVLCILLFLACTPTSPLTNLEQLEKLYQSNRFEQVLDLYAKKEKELKDNPSALNLIGKTYSSLYYYEQSLEYFDRAIELRPFEPLLHSNKCLTLVELKDYRIATISCSKALDLDGDNINAFINRSYAYIKLGEWQWALDDITSILKNKNISPEQEGIAYANLSTIYLNKGEMKMALETANKAIELNKKVVYWAYKNKAYIYMSRQEHATAWKNINLGLAIKPYDKELLYYKGMILVKSGKQKKGCDTILQSLDKYDRITEKGYGVVKFFYNQHCLPKSNIKI